MTHKNFESSIIIVLLKMMLRYVNGRKDANELTRDQGTTRRINVQPSRKLPKASFVSESTKTISPPPAYGEAIKTIFNSGQNSIVEGKAGSIESYRTLNGRTYAVVKVVKHLKHFYICWFNKIS